MVSNPAWGMGNPNKEPEKLNKRIERLGVNYVFDEGSVGVFGHVNRCCGFVVSPRLDEVERGGR